MSSTTLTDSWSSTPQSSQRISTISDVTSSSVTIMSPSEISSGTTVTSSSASVSSQTSPAESSQSMSSSSFPSPPPASPSPDPPQSSSSSSSTDTTTSISTSSTSSSPPFTTSPSSSSTTSPSSSQFSSITSLPSPVYSPPWSSPTTNDTQIQPSSSNPVSTVSTLVYLTVTSQGQVVTTAPRIVTVNMANATDGHVVTETSVVSSPTLSRNAPGNDSHFFANKGAVAAVSVVVGLAASSIIFWVAIVCRRRRKQNKIEREATTAAMAAVGITRAPPLDGEDRFTPPMVQRQWTFEDGTPFTSALDQDVEPNDHEWNHPYLTGYSVARPPRGALRVETRVYPSPPSPTSSQALRSSVGCGYGTSSSANRSSSHGHDTSHSGHDPLIPSSSSSHSPPTYTALNGSFQQRRPPLRESSVESHVPPVPPHIFTSFASSPQYISAQLDDDAVSSQSVYSQPSDVVHTGWLSPLDPTLGSRLRDGNVSGGTVGLHDNEDYSARPKLEIRNRTGSQRTLGTLE